ncbi:DNA-directed RNA polymerase III subunit RPC6-like protein [Blastocystis sp. ATCC 50177/Nand II]|uniref:DNA-directed RNA polymerase III subunit RPC6-like protein n=1 Tax=Blastocystis sp. subtype 1 (strain ATCC 50177 / NandII) TaxID=478820 RepID=A0A196S6D4_BLAHN|nr:DNA-directed RNA polymerase III subunit RPC6-like protein [Blastocystis sp. ATCC 50177/Nand II]
MSLKERFVQLLEKNEDGLDDKEIKKVFGEEYAGLVGSIQELLDENRLKILQGPDGYVFRLTTHDQIAKQTQLDDLGDAEMLVYQCIERSGNQGIWIREIKIRTGLHASAINRIIKKLVQRKLIKSFKSIASKMKIMYILYDMELPKDITGGPWYFEQEFDTEFVDIISQFVRKILTEEESGMDIGSILQKITLSNISNVPLSEKDVEQLLEKMSFCNVIEQITDLKGKRVWKLRKPTTSYDNISCTPCGECPLFYRCFCNAAVNPNRCPYINQWYDLGE